MSGFSEFVAIYPGTTAYAELTKIVVDPVKLEFFRGPKQISVSHDTNLVALKGMDIAIGTELLSLPEGYYLSLTARSKHDTPTKARVFCEQAIDRAVMNLSLVSDVSIFLNCIFRGWVVSKERSIHQHWVRVVEPVRIGERVKKSWGELDAKQNALGDSQLKINLMAKYFSKAIGCPPGDDRFLYLWTILEVWPMCGTSDIRSISDLIGKILSKDPRVVKERLGVGKIFGYRSKLLHDGVLPVEIAEMGQLFELLESICVEVMRNICGMEYSGKLDKFLAVT